MDEDEDIKALNEMLLVANSHLKENLSLEASLEDQLHQCYVKLLTTLGGIVGLPLTSLTSFSQGQYLCKLYCVVLSLGAIVVVTVGAVVFFWNSSLKRLAELERSHTYILHRRYIEKEVIVTMYRKCQKFITASTTIIDFFVRSNHGDSRGVDANTPLEVAVDIMAMVEDGGQAAKFYMAKRRILYHKRGQISTLNRATAGRADLQRVFKCRRWNINVLGCLAVMHAVAAPVLIYICKCYAP